MTIDKLKDIANLEVKPLDQDAVIAALAKAMADEYDRQFPDGATITIGDLTATAAVFTSMMFKTIMVQDLTVRPALSADEVRIRGVRLFSTISTQIVNGCQYSLDAAVKEYLEDRG